MNEHALRIDHSAKDTSLNTGHVSEYRSGIFAKPRHDGSGWGFVILDLFEQPRILTLSDGAVVGTTASTGKLEGPGVAPEHARVSVRSDGCYIEDLGTPEGTYVNGVRAQRIGMMHGDVVRLGNQLAVFVERDLSAYDGPLTRSGNLVHGPKQQRDWVDPVLAMAKAGSCICIEGTPGIGKRTLAKLSGAMREAAGDIVVVDGRGEAKSAVAPGVRPMTWVVLDADRLPRAQQLEIAHSAGRSNGVSVIATTNMPLDRAAGDGLIAPWFASLFSGKRISLPSLESRREDLPFIVRDIAERRGIPLMRFSSAFLEAILRAGWPGGVPELENVLVTAAEQSDGPLSPKVIADSLARSPKVKPTLPPSADPSLARARLEDALARANGSVASAARSLGMSRQAIYREADRLGLDIARRKLSRSA